MELDSIFSIKFMEYHKILTKNQHYAIMNPESINKQILPLFMRYRKIWYTINLLRLLRFSSNGVHDGALLYF